MPDFRGRRGVEWSYDESQRIGDRSGMGQVFRGIGPDARPIAVKRVGLRSPGEGEERRRAREVEIADLLTRSAEADAATDHLLIPLDWGFVEDDLLIAMPLAEGSLSAQVRKDDVDEDEKLHMLAEVATGLMQLAGLGVLHRDIKPDNVLQVQGKWMLADFGLARDLSQGTATYTFRGWGTLPYMAPELWEGRSATTKSDLYAFGVLAYELLLGFRPFKGPSQDDYSLQHRTAVPPQMVGVHPAVERLVLRLLRKHPAERPQDARAVVESLNARMRQLEADQQALQAAALKYEQRTAHDEAARGAAAVAAEQALERRMQAGSDLDDLLQDGTDRAKEALPEVILRKGEDYWKIQTPVTSVYFRLFETGAPSDVREDPLVHAGTVHFNVENWTVLGGGPPVANIVCEMQDGRLEWFLLRFSVNPIVRLHVYNLGPADSEHGFPEPVFFDQRPYMLMGGMHVWQKRQQRLTPALVVQLLVEAMEVASH
ncbi:serine/threonine-protein kinase [Microbispora triticiradicis]|uniref:serine/threonine-protein kinase n=1 Tax=Microbispora triticiradicis TaxID=2200763 RepID=UPI001AD649C2|nr:serine/threonine-protein kinase [Microbispora triticiradicis]MBO4273341.1 protein kinase [Microbispora triticiradicis]